MLFGLSLLDRVFSYVDTLITSMKPIKMLSGISISLYNLKKKKKKRICYNWSIQLEAECYVFQNFTIHLSIALLIFFFCLWFSKEPKAYRISFVSELFWHTDIYCDFFSTSNHYILFWRSTVFSGFYPNLGFSNLKWDFGDKFIFKMYMNTPPYLNALLRSNSTD